MTVTRRRFLTYVVAGPTVVAAARWADASPSLLTGTDMQPIPSPPGAADTYDLNDMLTDSTRATANMITVTMNKNGTASFALPRVETGQGITTSSAMLIAEELGIPVSKVHVTLADARPELHMNQFTAGSNTTISTYQPIRMAAAAAKQQMLLAAADELAVDIKDLTTEDGVVRAPDGRTMTYGALAEKAAATTTRQIEVVLAPTSTFVPIWQMPQVLSRPRWRTSTTTGVTACVASSTTSTTATSHCGTRPRRTSRWSRRSRRRPAVTDFAALGFDPAPGDADGLQEAGGAWLALSAQLAEEADGVRALQSGLSWNGRAATACVERLHVVPSDLHTAADACRAAGRTLQHYADELRRLQRQAADLEASAAQQLRVARSASTDDDAQAAHRELARRRARRRSAPRRRPGSGPRRRGRTRSRPRRCAALPRLVPSHAARPR